MLRFFFGRPVLHMRRGMRSDDAIDVFYGGYGASFGFVLTVLPIVLDFAYTARRANFQGVREP